MPALAAEGGDARNLARLASRLARANAAVEVLADGAERYLALRDRQAPQPDWRRTFDAKSFDAKTFDARTFDAKAFAAMPEEIRLRLLLRAINRFGHEGPAELGKVEALLAALDRHGGGKTPQWAGQDRAELKQTLAGALVSLIDGRIRIEPAPPRRRRDSLTAGAALPVASGLFPREVLTTPEKHRFRRHYLNGNRARMG